MLAGVQGEGPDRPASQAERKGGGRPETVGGQQWVPRRHALVVQGVLHDDGSVLADRGSHDAAAARFVPGRHDDPVEDRDVDAGAGCLAHVTVGLDEPDPAQLEAAHLRGDAAGFFQQGVAVADPNDCLVDLAQKRVDAVELGHSTQRLAGASGVPCRQHEAPDRAVGRQVRLDIEFPVEAGAVFLVAEDSVHGLCRLRRSCSQLPHLAASGRR